jgi:hypothetical protein
MAGKPTSVYLTVADKKTHKSVLSKTFFKMADLNAFVGTEEFKEKYPAEQFYIVKEVY